MLEIPNEIDWMYAKHIALHPVDEQTRQIIMESKDKIMDHIIRLIDIGLDIANELNVDLEDKWK